MKLIGDVRSIERLIAKKATNGTVEEKRVFNLNIRPAAAVPSSGSYAYCSLKFIAHGKELTDVGLELGSLVDVYICPTMAEYSGKDTEDARAELALEIAKHATTLSNYDRSQSVLSAANARLQENTARITGLQLENVRLLTELTTLKQMLHRPDDSLLLEG